MIPPLQERNSHAAPLALLRASRRNFKSRQVETARDLLEKCLEDLPDRRAITKP